MLKNSWQVIYHKLMSIVLAVLCLFVLGMPEVLSAAQQPELNRKVRIGCFDLKSFVDKNAHGEYYGYGIDYLNQICMYTDWKYEIIVADNVSLQKMLANGEIDFLMPVNFSRSRVADFAYPNYPIGAQFDGLYVLANREDVFYEDFQAFSKMKIGAVTDTFPAMSMRSYAQSHNFTYTEVLYPNLQALHDAMRTGQVDAACLSALGNIPANYRLVARTELIPFYIVASNSHAGYLFNQLDRAINSIYAKNPQLQNQLYDNYLKRTDFDKERSFSREEMAYLKQHPVLNVMGASDRYPICFKDSDGNLDGILKGLMDLITAKTGVQFKYYVNKPNYNIQEGLKNPDINLVVGLIRTANFRQDEHMILSRGLLNNTTGIVGKKGQPFDINKPYKVAIPGSALGTNNHTKAYHPDYTIVNYPTIEECLRAVIRGEVEGAIQNADILAATLQHPEFSNLTLWHTFAGEGEYSYCLAVRAKDDPVLLSIINKCIATLDANDIEAMRIKYASAAQYEMTLRDVMAKYGPVIILVALLLAIIAGGLIYIFRTKQKNIVKLSLAMEESKQANRAKSDFLSRMSHDMRTPLNVIIGMVYLAREEQLTPVLTGYLSKIDMSSKFLLSLINDILDMAKVESNKIELHTEPYLKEEFIAYMNAVIQPLVDGKNQHLKFQLIAEKGHVPILDKLRFNQIIFNLLSNAVKYTPEGGNITYHSLATMKPDGTLNIHIEIGDNGIGMSEDFQKIIFEPFTQERTSDVDTNRGTGLGMAITNRLVKLMKGTITVNSKLKEGSTFILDIPAKAVPRSEVAKIDEKHSEEVQENTLQGKHILLCEDHPLNQEIAKKLLEKKGAQVVIAENGAQGVEYFQSSVPCFYDAILMDIRMPVMNGYDATKAIRQLSRKDAATIPIIAMTADAFADDVQKCLDAGMNAHIAKPINPKVMFDTLAKQLH